jgi:N-acetyl-alpha-D-glucosaminyl L-malate synthase BshA
MKIGITCYPTYGGSGVVATELGKKLASDGHEVHFISYAIPYRLSQFVENIFFHEVEISSYPLFEHQLYGLSLTSKMLEVIQFEKLDLIHVHYAIPHATSAYLAKQYLKKENSDIKIITTLHGTDITLVGLEPSFLPLVKLSIEESDGVTAVSRFLKEKTITNYNINKDIRVIYNFIDTEIFKPLENEQFRKRIAPEGEKILVHTSNFRGVKRVPDTIKILAKVREEIPAKLLLIGDGPDRQSESFGLSALEAMACGLPVVSSSVGGLPELITHNETGFIAEIGDVNRMAKYTVELLNNKKRYNVFSKNSRERAVKKFEINLIVPQYIKHYEEVLQQ